MHYKRIGLALSGVILLALVLSSGPAEASTAGQFCGRSSAGRTSGNLACVVTRGHYRWVPLADSPVVVDLDSSCDGDLRFGLSEFRGHFRSPLHDRGRGLAEVHDTNRGRWLAFTKFQSSGGEGSIRLDVAGLKSAGVAWDLIRVTYDGWRSENLPEGNVNCGTTTTVTATATETATVTVTAPPATTTVTVTAPPATTTVTVTAPPLEVVWTEVVPTVDPASGDGLLAVLAKPKAVQVTTSEEHPQWTDPGPWTYDEAAKQVRLPATNFQSSGGRKYRVQ